MSALDRDLVIIGGGPAGMAAALEARRHGVQTLLIDERTSLGGQIYRQPAPGPRPPTREARTGRVIADEVAASGAEIRLQTTVWGATGNELAVACADSSCARIRARKIIVAAGAYDRPIAFPGWTLPGVMTAGCAHALVTTQHVVPGKRILVAGSGALIVSFAAQLHRHGANVVGVLEAATRPTVAAVTRLIAAGASAPSVLFAGARQFTYLRRKRVPLRYSHVIVRATGDREVSEAAIARVDRDWQPIPGTEETIDVDTVCLGYGFLSSSELTRLMGCAHFYDDSLGGWIPRRDAYMRTSVDGVYAVGDGAGVGGSLLAESEGRLAGATAARDLGMLAGASPTRTVQDLTRRVERLERLRRALANLFPFGTGVYQLAKPETIVCRCEEVTQAQLLAAIGAGCHTADAVKSITRAGMGYCQGRNCGVHVEALVNVPSGALAQDRQGFRTRAPVKPIPISVLAEERFQEDPTAREWAIAMSARQRTGRSSEE
jgi:thioredoxin reductase